MATHTMVQSAAVGQEDAATFERIAGYAAFTAGTAGLLYSISFVLLKEPLLYSIFLMIGGIASTLVMVGLYRRLKSVDAGSAQWAAIVGIVAAIGSVMHGGYDLSNSINPPAAINSDLPSQIDPRGLLTFGVAGLSLFGIAWLMSKGGGFPRNLSYLAYVLAALLVVIYLGRLIILDPSNLALLIPAGITGFIISPAWNILVGVNLIRQEKPH